MLVGYYGVCKKFCEWSYIQGVLENLNLDDSYRLYIVSTTPELDFTDKVKLDNKRKNVIISLADEWSADNIPQDWKDNATVFKAYLKPEQEEDNVHHFPLGYNNKHKKLPYKPIKSRPIDVFFAGHIASVNRLHYMRWVIEYFQELKPEERPNYEFAISKGFNLGLDGKEYSQKLHDAKIVICPAGNVSMETFRHYEAMRSGAVVVSPKLPQTKIYKDAAICQVDKWEYQVGDTIMDLLSDVDMLQLVQDRQQQTYNNRFTVKSVAKYINELLPDTKQTLLL